MQMKRMRHDGTAPTGRRVTVPIDQAMTAVSYSQREQKKQSLPEGVRCFHFTYIMSAYFKISLDADM